jgi:hypothetical protein
MLSSPNPQISSSIHATALPRTSSTSSTSFTSFTSFTSPFCFTQSLPTFSTPSKHRAHTNARLFRAHAARGNSIPFMRLLHTSLDTPGGGYLLARKPSCNFTCGSRSNSRPLTLSLEGAIPISALSLFSLFATKSTNLTPLFSCSSPLFKKECLPKPFAIKLFRTLSQNTRGCALSFSSHFNFKVPALFTLSLEGSGVEGSTRNLFSPIDALDAASSISPLFATLTKNTGGWGHILQTKKFRVYYLSLAHPFRAYSRSKP